MSRSLPALIRITGTHTNERVAYASTAVGTAINDIYTTPIPIRSDSNGKVYLRPGFDSGSDNDGDYELYFQLVRG